LLGGRTTKGEELITGKIEPEEVSIGGNKAKREPANTIDYS